MTTARPSAAVIDIDGTLTRRRFGGASPDTYRPQIYDPAARTPYCWDRVGEDPVNPPVVEVVRALHATGHTIVVVSGRSEVCRAETEAWLARHDIPHTELHMATRGEAESGVPDSAVKRRIHDTLIAPRYRVLICIDDRQQVVDVWRGLGYVCAQVGPGNF